MRKKQEEVVSEDKEKVANEEPKKKDNEIDQEKLDKIKDEIKSTKKKIKENPKNKQIKKDIIRNVLIAVVITVYFLFINLGVNAIPATEYVLDLQTLSIFAIIIAIIIFERAYKKDANYLALHGIEMIVVAIETLVILQFYSAESKYFYYVLFGVMLGMVLYYIIKSLVIYIRAKIKKK